MAVPSSVTAHGPPSSRARAVVEGLARSPRRAFAVIFLLAFAVRLAELPFVPRVAIVPHTQWEIEAVAVSLATAGAFADPYALPTGATAHLPPAYPAWLALIYRLFGLTPTAGYVAWLLRIAAAATVFAMLPWAALRFGLRAEAGTVGGLAGAVVPTWPHQVEPLAAIAMALLLVAFTRRWEGGVHTVGRSLLFGLAWGAAFHVTPSLLPVMVGGLVFELWWRRDRRRWRAAAAIVLGAALACLPWSWRNYHALGGVFFVRSNFGLELRMGNHDGAVADVDVMDRLEGPAMHHPRANLADARLIQEVGELEYMRRARQEALEWIRGHPGAFLRLTAQRVFHFWFGAPSQAWLAVGATLLSIVALLGARHLLPGLTVPQRASLLIPLLTYPLVYYVVVYTQRYAEAVNWILLLLAGAEGWRWISRIGRTPGRT